MTLEVSVVSPERVLFEAEADLVVCRTTEGEIGFQTGHAPFMGLLGIGSVRLHGGTAESNAAVHGGFVEVRDNKVNILCDVAETSDQIDVPRAREALQRSGQAVSAASSDADTEEAEAAKRRAEVRLEVAGQA